MEVIGEKLKASREEKGLSLEEVSEDLKIDIKDLENIEIGNRKYFDDVYSLKNYIYEYAKYLGLDTETLVEEFNEFMFEYTSKIPVDVIERISKQKEKEEMSKGALSPYTIINRKSSKKIIAIVLIIIAILISIFTVFYVTNREKKSDELVFSALI